MKKLIDLAMKFSGLGWVWEKVDGYKLYVTGAVAVLNGAAGVLIGLLGATSGHSWGAIWAWLQSLPHDPAWLSLMGGVGAIAAAHKGQKILEAINPTNLETK